MIVPQNRLLFWVAAGIFPVSLLAAFVPALSALSAAVFLLLLLIAALDALLGGGRLEGISLESGGCVRLSKDRPGEIPIRIRNEPQKGRSLRLALALPETIVAENEEQSIRLPAGAACSSLKWNCLPTRRGRFWLRQAYLETASPLGLWAMRARLDANLEIRVYPNLLKERNQLAELFLNRGRYGVHAQRQVGKGREFEKLREYIPGDSYEDIHWKATARRAHPVTKVFQIEKTQEIYVILDGSRLSARTPLLPTQKEGARPPNPETAFERFVTAALILGLAAERQGDNFGVMAFSDRIDAFARAKNGRSHFQTCRDMLYTLQPREVSPDFDEVASFIRLRLRRRALLFFLTSLDDPVLAESFARNLGLLCRQHLIMVNMLRAAETGLIFSQGEVRAVDDIYRHLAGHLRWRSLRELEKVLHRQGVKLSLIENEKLCASLVSQYLNVKQRQLL